MICSQHSVSCICFSHDSSLYLLNNDYLFSFVLIFILLWSNLTEEYQFSAKIPCYNGFNKCFHFHNNQIAPKARHEIVMVSPFFIGLFFDSKHQTFIKFSFHTKNHNLIDFHFADNCVVPMVNQMTYLMYWSHQYKRTYLVNISEHLQSLDLWSW